MIEQIIYWPCDYIKNQFAEKYPPLSHKINKKHQAVIPSYARRWRENGLGWPRKVPGRTCARWRDFGEQRLRKSMDPRTRYLYSDIISGVWMYLVNDIIIFYLYNIYHIYIWYFGWYFHVFAFDVFCLPVCNTLENNLGIQIKYNHALSGRQLDQLSLMNWVTLPDIFTTTPTKSMLWPSCFCFTPWQFNSLLWNICIPIFCRQIIELNGPVSIDFPNIYIYT